MILTQEMSQYDYLRFHIYRLFQVD